MDINLTGEIATSLVRNLTPNWYNPVIAALAAIIASFLTGVITLKGIMIANKNAEEREKRSRDEEDRVRRTEELKSIYKDKAQKKLELYSQIRGVKPIITHDLIEVPLNYIESLRYLNYMEIEGEGLKTDENDFADAYTKTKKIHIYSDARNKKNEELKSSQKALTEDFTKLGEKLAQSIIIFEGNREDLKKLVSSVESLRYQNHKVITDVSEFLEQQENGKQEDVDKNIEIAYDEFYFPHIAKVEFTLDNLSNFLEKEIENDPPWWQIYQQQESNELQHTQ